MAVRTWKLALVYLFIYFLLINMKRDPYFRPHHWLHKLVNRLDKICRTVSGGVQANWIRPKCMNFLFYWQASEASETLTRVTQLKIFSYLTWRLTPSQTSLNRFLGFSDHYPYHLRNWMFTALNYFAGTVITKKLWKFYFYSSYLRW